MAKLIVEQAKCIREQESVNQVALSGGVFQNRVLTETAVAMLEQAGFIVIIPAQIPVNDAGISFGQVIEFGFKGQ
ncbi:hydrogenase maturation protein HypF [Candidatus Thiomargarita nelsonii]|uniref:Hydrogenase maturation protein HypF n=1 Tax=Candidatus Thiomargarita nelsonii TaxID=1003181 RepID=A0A176RUL3_9GAMM|nr:hydrogenase maturation protein HypF [Candidatus Thiomargarita nelsonii]